MVQAPDAWLITKSAGATNAVEFIGGIAEGMTDQPHGTERDLLRKSLEETLFYAAGRKAELSPLQIGKRFKRYVRSHGQAELLRRFMIVHSFNIVWFRSSEVVRESATTLDSFEASMRKTQRACRLVVSSIWKPHETHKPLALTTAEDLVGAIEAALAAL